MTGRIKRTFHNHKYLIGAFVIPVIIMEMVAVVMKVQPFGNESFLIVDALHQYLPFFADYHEKLRSADGLFYSFHGGLGYNFLGLWAYYLASPLNLIIILFPKAMLNMVLSHLYIVKIALCCFAAAYYFRKRRGKDEVSILAFGMAYGFSGYIIGYSWNIMWLEVMILLPVILYGLDRLIKEKDGRLYCFALFLSLFCNFYMSFMTCLFLVIWYLLYEHKGIGAFFKNGIRFAGYSLLSGAMAAGVLLPAYLGIMQTSSAKWDFPKELWYGTFGDLFSRHFLGTEPITMSVNDGQINLYCGIFTLMMVLFYLVSKEIKWTIRLRRLFLVIFLFFSFNMPVLGYVWHGFHNQYGIPNRYAFLYIFLLLLMAYDGYILIAREGRRHVGKIYIALGVLCIFMAVTLFTSNDAISPRIIYLTIGIALAYTIIFVLYEKRVFSRKIFTIIISMTLAGEMTVMAFSGFSSNGTVDVDNYFQDTKVIAKFKETYKTGVDKRADLVSGRMLDESIWHTLNCVTLFGSTAQGNVVDIMDQLGFYTGVNEYLYEGSTPFTNNLFGVKYQIYRPHDTRLTPFRIFDSIGNITIYKNPYTVNLGYGMDSYIDHWDSSHANPFYVQNDMIEKAYGISGLFHMIDTERPKLNACKITRYNGNGEYVFENTSAQTDNMVFTIKAEETREMYLHFDGSQVENTVIEVNGEQSLSGRLNSQILYLGKRTKGDEVTIKMQLKQDDVMSGVVRITTAYLDEGVMADVYGVMQDQAFRIKKESSSEVQGTIDLKEDGTVFFSIPYDKGWTVYVDGKKGKTKAIGKAFLGVEAEEGTHEIRLVYVPSGFKEGIILSIAGFVIFLLLCYHFRKKKISKL